MFVKSLHGVYLDIYELVKLGFSAEYVEKLSPLERGMYKSYHEMEQSNKYSDENRRAAEEVGLDIGDL